MNRQERDALIQKIGKEWTDKGKLIEAGFAAMHMMSFPDAPPHQVRDMRVAFFGGAQHVFGTLMSILEGGDEPTENDLRRMGMIDKELREFITEFRKQNLQAPKGHA